MSSFLGAAATLYLDFDGHFEARRGNHANVVTPVFDIDSNPAINDGETAMITEIWQRVTETFSPFEINVTTVEPSSFADGVALRVAIGGDGAWFGQVAGGASFVNSFTNPFLLDVAFVIPLSQPLGTTAKYLAISVSHEAGHAFGLWHQSVYDSSGRLTAEYNPGNADIAPVMGTPFLADRALWWYGPSNVCSTTYQDDMAVLSESNNGFGYRDDGIGHSLYSATSLDKVGQFRHPGVISQTNQADYFSFDTDGGRFKFTLNVAAVGATLDSRLRLLDGAGRVVASVDPSDSLGATLSVTGLAGGRYYLEVASHGNYGDVGSYILNINTQSISTFAIPLSGDFNGDGVTDVGIYQPNNDFFALNYLNAQTQSIGQAVFLYGYHTNGVLGGALPTTVNSPLGNGISARRIEALGTPSFEEFGVGATPSVVIPAVAATAAPTSSLTPAAFRVSTAQSPLTGSTKAMRINIAIHDAAILSMGARGKAWKWDHNSPIQQGDRASCLMRPAPRARIELSRSGRLLDARIA